MHEMNINHNEKTPHALYGYSPPGETRACHKCRISPDMRLSETSWPSI